MTLLTFLLSLLEHDCTLLGCQHRQEISSPLCEVSRSRLVAWTNKQERKFQIKFFDGRSKKPLNPRNESMTHFELYARYVGREEVQQPIDLSKAKGRMKANLKSHVIGNSLRLTSDEKETDVKEYQFLDPLISVSNPQGGPCSGSSTENITRPQNGQSTYCDMPANQTSVFNFITQMSSGRSSSYNESLGHQISRSSLGSQSSGELKPGILPVPPDFSQQTTTYLLDAPSVYQIAGRENPEIGENGFIGNADGCQTMTVGFHVSSNSQIAQDESVSQMELQTFNSQNNHVHLNTEGSFYFANQTSDNTHYTNGNNQQSMFNTNEQPQNTGLPYVAGSGTALCTNQEDMQVSEEFVSVPSTSQMTTNFSIVKDEQTSFDYQTDFDHPDANQSTIPEIEMNTTNGQNSINDFSDLIQIDKPHIFPQQLEDIKDELSPLLSPHRFEATASPSQLQFISGPSETVVASSGSTGSNPQLHLESAHLNNSSNDNTSNNVNNEVGPVQPEPEPQCRSTMEKFVNFVREPDEAGYELDDEDILLLKNREKMKKLKAWPSYLVDLKIDIHAKLKPDEPMQMWKAVAVDEAVSPGGFILYRKTNQGLDYDDVHRFGPKTLEGQTLDRIDVDLENVSNDEVHKCLETFERSGVVFLWRHYEEPDNLSTVVQSPEVREMLCRRLYCYRINKGYPSRSAQVKQRHDKEERLKMLDMCIRPAGLQSEGIELEVHGEFLLVFDLLKEIIAALKIRRMVNSGDMSSRDELKKVEKMQSSLKVYLGMRSKKRYDSDDLPMRIVISNNFIERLFIKSSSEKADADKHSSTTRSISCKSENQRS